MKKRLLLLLSLGFSPVFVFAQSAVSVKIDQKAQSLEPKIVEWRRDFHQNPELGNREFKTAEKIAKHLKSLGIEVQTGVAKTGVVGILKGGKPGPVVALRADMDGLPVTERVEVPFKSTVTTDYNGQKVGVMHACGHDTHISILMGVAEVLSSIKGDLIGTVKFIFQPAEEGAPEGEEGGAKLMVKEGVLENPKVDAIFGLHINSQTEVGKISYKPGATMAAVDFFSIDVKGKQTHGAYPWSGVDPIVTSSQIVMGLQTIVARNLDITKAPAVVTIGAINGGIRQNIIPEQVKMIGTIRTFDEDMHAQVHKRVTEIATNIAESAGAKADVNINTLYPVTFNDVPLTEEMIGTLQNVAGKENVQLIAAVTGAEDFSYYQQKVPGFFFFLGGMPKGKDPLTASAHHTPDFFIDDSGMVLGVRSLSRLTVDYMEKKTKK
ncbi:carboxypeptidase Ss1. Metallo peptidase. MEROPS family M20D [Dyadobacter koreensis]|uniref:Carboxypeptidase Ss1. Metallo peptidase. MEROPS family M20D n=1 Tax=Dyadobacter koreensis TaxID=408657 RepID=A0A1H6RQT8_9BACT|nr:amidohydrolase [Dyadobacter koreensis]SEI55784.1 carboxypeptidase Ss1. Metallo peptidase. MEROPS family M20D [Dyadobacter koreensis]